MGCGWEGGTLPKQQPPCYCFFFNPERERDLQGCLQIKKLRFWDLSTLPEICTGAGLRQRAVATTAMLTPVDVLHS